MWDRFYYQSPDQFENSTLKIEENKKEKNIELKKTDSPVKKYSTDQFKKISVNKKLLMNDEFE